MPTRDLSNKRVQLWLGPSSSLASWDHTTDLELADMLMIAPAVRWDGLDFGMQASQQEDDRSLDDDATSTIRGFMQFGGALPFFFPKVTDLNSVLRDVYDLVKVRGTELALVMRAGWVDRRTPGTAGDNVSLFKVMTDGFNPDTEGTGGYAYIQNLLPRGDVAPWTVVGDEASPGQVAIVGGAVTGTAGGLALRRATYEGNDITQRGTWSSDDQSIAIVRNGIIEMLAVGTADITVTYPGGLVSTAITVTVS